MFLVSGRKLKENPEKLKNYIFEKTLRKIYYQPQL